MIPKQGIWKIICDLCNLCVICVNTVSKQSNALWFDATGVACFVLLLTNMNSKMTFPQLQLVSPIPVDIWLGMGRRELNSSFYINLFFFFNSASCGQSWQQVLYNAFLHVMNLRGVSVWLGCRIPGAAEPPVINTLVIACLFVSMCICSFSLSLLADPMGAGQIR